MLPAYTELHCLSNFSFLRGASSPEELAERAQALGYAALAITDECSVSGAVRAHFAAKEAGLPLVIGSELTLVDGTKLVLLATDRASYGNLTQLITRGRRQAKKGTYALSRADVAAFADGLLALWIPPDVKGPGSISGDGDEGQCETKVGSDSTFRPRLALSCDASEKSSLTLLSLATARWVAATFPHRGWIAVELFARALDRARLVRCTALSQASGLPQVAAGDVHMHARARRALQDTVTAIRVKKPLSECGHALFSNGERHLRSRARLATS